MPLVAGEHEGDLDVSELLKVPRPTPVLDDLATDIDQAGTGDIQRRTDLARAVGRDPDDRHVGRALEELEADGGWEKVGRGKWRKIGIGVSKATPMPMLRTGGRRER